MLCRKDKKLSFYGQGESLHCAFGRRRPNPWPPFLAIFRRRTRAGPRRSSTSIKYLLPPPRLVCVRAEGNLLLLLLLLPRSRLILATPRRLPRVTAASMEHDGESRRGFGRMGFGCKHYRRRCRIRAPCCNDVFHCRHCHNESTKDGHELDRHAIESVICLVCDTEQPVAQECCHCGVVMGEYFCRTCKFFDDDVDKEHYHCKECGICRVGGKENFFHCQKCGSCYSSTLRDKHLCIENSMKNNCPICYEYMFDSLRETSVLRCGHTMHLQCFHEMLKHDKFSCPICSTSIFDMDKFLRALDAEMEENYFYMGKGWIVCNDCRDTTQVYSGVAGHKCCHCQSYNTCRVSPPVLP